MKKILFILFILVFAFAASACELIEELEKAIKDASPGAEVTVLDTSGNPISNATVYVCNVVTNENTLEAVNEDGTLDVDALKPDCDMDTTDTDGTLKIVSENTVAGAYVVMAEADFYSSDMQGLDAESRSIATTVENYVNGDKDALVWTADGSLEVEFVLRGGPDPVEPPSEEETAPAEIEEDDSAPLTTEEQGIDPETGGQGDPEAEEVDVEDQPDPETTAPEEPETCSEWTFAAEYDDTTVTADGTESNQFVSLADVTNRVITLSGTYSDSSLNGLEATLIVDFKPNDKEDFVRSEFDVYLKGGEFPYLQQVLTPGGTTRLWVKANDSSDLSCFVQFTGQKPGGDDNADLPDKPNPVMVILKWDNGDPQDANGSPLGEEPKSDLDIHVVDLGTGNKVYYAQMSPGFATLDVDNRYGFGPETVTFEQGEDISDGVTVNIHAWFVKGDATTPKVQVITANGFNQTFTGDPMSSGDWWEVGTFNEDGPVE